MVICCYSVSLTGYFTSLTSNLGLGYNGKTDVNAIARRSSHAIKAPGPTITGVIDNRLVGPADSPLSGYVIQDGCIPEPMIPVIQMMFTLQTLRDQVKCYASNPLEGGRRTLAALKSLLFGPYARGGALQRTSTYLVMSHDSNEMTLTLDSDQLRLRAPSEGRSENSKKIKKLLNTLFGFTQASMGFSYFYGKNHRYCRWSKLTQIRPPRGGSYCSSTWGS